MGRIKWVPLSDETKKLFEKPIIFVEMIPDLSSDESESKPETPPEPPTSAEPQESQPDSEFNDCK